MLEAGFSGFLPWMEHPGFHLFICPEHRQLKEEVEDLLFTSDLRYALEALLYLKDPPEKIVRKLSMRFAAPASVEAVRWYERLFFSQELSPEEWRIYSAFSTETQQAQPPIHFLAKTKSAHQIEAMIGVDAEVDPAHLLKEGLGMVYDRLKTNWELGDNADKRETQWLYSSLLKTAQLLIRNKETSPTDLSQKLGAGFRRARQDNEDVRQLSLLEDGEDHTPLPPEGAAIKGGTPFGGPKDPAGLIRSTVDNPVKIDDFTLPEGEYLI